MHHHIRKISLCAKYCRNNSTTYVVKSRQHDYNKTMIEEIFKTLGFKEEETKTYLSLLDAGASSGGDLAKKMGAPRPTIYGYLDNLVEGGLITQSIQRGIKIFTAEPGDKIRLLYKRKIDELKSKEKALDNIIPELEKRAGMSLFKPKMQFFEGQSGVQNLMEDIFHYSDLETYVFWPIEFMLDILTAEFLQYHNKLRIQKNLSLKALWQREQAQNLRKPPYLGTGKNYLREIRIAPYDMDFRMGCWFYANKAIYISSRAESFGFMIESTEMVELLTAQHNIIWPISEPFTINPKGADSFLKEVYEN